MAALIAMVATVAIPALVGCVTSVLSYLKSKAAYEQSLTNTVHAKQINQTVSAIKIEVNDRLTQLLKATEAAAHAAGVIAGTQAEIARALQANGKTDTASLASGIVETAARAAGVVEGTAIEAARQLTAKGQGQAK